MFYTYPESEDKLKDVIQTLLKTPQRPISWLWLILVVWGRPRIFHFRDRGLFTLKWGNLKTYKRGLMKSLNLREKQFLNRNRNLLYLYLAQCFAASAFHLLNGVVCISAYKHTTNCCWCSKKANNNLSFLSLFIKFWLSWSCFKKPSENCLLFWWKL